jgi:hypothetical protein
MSRRATPRYRGRQLYGLQYLYNICFAVLTYNFKISSFAVLGLKYLIFRADARRLAIDRGRAGGCTLVLKYLI